MTTELIIKINADLKDFNKKLEQTQKRTQEFNDSLSKLGTIAGLAFAGLSAITYKTTEAFKQANKASMMLEQSLKAQGIYSKETIDSYKQMARELQNLVSVDDDAIISGQAILQRFLGQNKITKELTLAVVDYAQATGTDLDTAFQKVGKTIATKMNPLAREYGLEIQDGLSVTEKMAVVTDKLNGKWGDSARVLAEAKGPVEKLKVSYGNLEEGIGQKLMPMVDSLASSFADITVYIGESDIALKAIGLTIATGLGFAGLTLGIVGAVKAFVALEAVAVTLGTTIGVLTGGIGLAVVALGGLFAYFASRGEKPKSIEQAKKSVEELEKKIKDIKERDPRGIALVSEMINLQSELKHAKKDLDDLTNANKNLAKAQQGTVTSGKETTAQLEAEGKKREELKQIEKDRVEEAKKLSKELIDAGKTEMQHLEDERSRRLKIAKDDKSLQLQIEADFYDKKSKLEIENHKKLLEMRSYEDEYEKQRIEKRKKMITESASNPFSAISGFNGKTDAEKKDTLLGAGAGVANAVVSGKEGARGLLVAGASAGLDMLAPGLGQAMGPLISALTQGPDAVRSMVKEFAQALPDLIEGFIEAIPVFIEELANQTPVIIERLLEKLPQIINSLISQLPRVITSLVMQTPRIVMAFIRQIPSMITSFIEELIKGAPKFIEELIKAIGNFATGGIFGGGGGGGGGILGGIGGAIGGVVSSVGDIFGFAEGGQLYAKEVPMGFAGDTYPARLSSGELVVDRSTASGLREFIDRENGNQGTDINTGLLSKMLSLLEAPMTVETSVQVNQKAFADIILQLNRNNARLA